MGKPKFEPLGGRILVKREAVETRTPGGVYLPPSSESGIAQAKPQRGVVLAIDSGGGFGAMIGNGLVRIGDTVVFPAFAGTEVEGVGLVLMPDDLLGRFRVEKKKPKK